MKPILVCFVLLLSLSRGAAQGGVLFGNSLLFQTQAERHLFGLNGDYLIGTNWCVQLYYGSSVAGLVATTSPPLHLLDYTRAGPGVWSTAFRYLDGFDLGETVAVQVKVWDCSLFPTFEQAYASGGIYGQSDPFSYMIPVAGAPFEAYYMENFRGFPLVPEPSALTLLGVALAGFLALRRRP